MLNKVNQSKSNVNGDQIAGDKTVNIYNMEITKELTPATDPIRTYINDSISSDPENTILIRKLRDGDFNKSFIDHAIKSKANYLANQITLCDSEEGKNFLNDIQANLLMLINDKYISKMNEGDTLKMNLSDMVSDFSTIVNKYNGVISIDEALIEGMLYSITSQCAINWRIEGFDNES